jgi:large subunit ribosomal protein L17
MGRKGIEGKTGKTSDYTRAMYRNLVTSLLKHEKITTTEPRAKEVRGLAEKMITLGKKGGLHSRRQALAYIYEKSVTEKVFSELAERYAQRPGGYTRIVKLGNRLGDGASLVQLELVK